MLIDHAGVILWGGDDLKGDIADDLTGACMFCEVQRVIK